MGSVLRIFYCTILVVALWAGCVVMFALYANRYALPENAEADGIVVLTGGGGRVEYGLELLGNGRAQALFISGVNKSVPLNDLINKAPETMRAAIGALSFGRITVGREAENTIGNAQESGDWITGRGYKRVMLVTADYHMPRALTEFKTMLPKDVELIPAPVKTRNYRDMRWVFEPVTRNIILSEFHKLIVAKLRHLFIEATRLL